MTRNIRKRSTNCRWRAYEKTARTAIFPLLQEFPFVHDGIVAVEFVLRDLEPVMQLHYVKSMWTAEQLWKEVFQAEKWTLRMADGTFKEAEPRLQFLVEGRTVEEN